ncbi:B- and T-lymphocyte attenuator-like [Gambusia affinis]|uniref:B- and T-lymphocyte attenuator-like n=1 Tax=Gambusia affinis TaxID=33528 RepID=UPI001CDD2417|nr:B- and T-lymphocyte attenuator-like [Gambusia affinis]
MNRGGKMKLLLRSLLLSSLCALSSWSVSSDALVVTQSPDVSVQEGETGNITCCWEGTAERVGIKWLKNQTLINNKTVLIQSTGSKNEQKSKCSVLIIENMIRSDSGRYICKVTVEIPLLAIAEGKGTTITVTSRKNITDSTTKDQKENLPQPVIIAMGVVVPLFLITLICFCCLRKKEGQAARVIYEVPHTDSVEADMDKSSTSSSRGSTQWCEVAMYDSLDYFERVEPKRTK